jgi:hypothetical protein
MQCNLYLWLLDHCLCTGSGSVKVPGVLVVLMVLWVLLSGPLVQSKERAATVATNVTNVTNVTNATNADGDLTLFAARHFYINMDPEWIIP